jgi:hypothetical protein
MEPIPSARTHHVGNRGLICKGVQYRASFSGSRFPFKLNMINASGVKSSVLEVLKGTFHLCINDIMEEQSVSIPRTTCGTRRRTIAQSITQSLPCIVSTSWNQRADTTLQTRNHTQKVVLKSPVASCTGKGSCLNSSRALTSAPCSSNNRATWIFPLSTARCSGVLPRYPGHQSLPRVQVAFEQTRRVLGVPRRNSGVATIVSRALISAP